MVTNVTSLTGNGLKDWLIQRLTAVYFAVFSCFLLGFILLHPHLTYEEWSALFQNKVFQVASIIALFALTLHTWIGLWTVTTDYLKCMALRVSIQSLVFLLLLAQFVSGLMMIWGR